jgi:hypothetical protein
MDLRTTMIPVLLLVDVETSDHPEFPHMMTVRLLAKEVRLPVLFPGLRIAGHCGYGMMEVRHVGHHFGAPGAHKTFAHLGVMSFPGKPFDDVCDGFALWELIPPIDEMKFREV